MEGTLLYDGDCRFCTSTVGWLHSHAAGAAQVVPWQYADLDRLGLRAADCDETVQWVADGSRAVGPDAVAAYLRTSTPRWQAVGRLLTAPALRVVAWPLYRFLTQHREHLPGGTPASQLPRGGPSSKGIRRRRPHDLAACVRLLRIVHMEAEYPWFWPEEPRAFLQDHVLSAWVSDHLGEILGHVAVLEVAPTSYPALRWQELLGREPGSLGLVSRLFVRPSARGQGIASALLDVAVSDARARGLTPVAEVVGVNADARRLLERAGWRMRSMGPWPDDPSERLYCYDAPPAE